MKYVTTPENLQSMLENYRKAAPSELAKGFPQYFVEQTMQANEATLDARDFAENMETLREWTDAASAYCKDPVGYALANTPAIECPDCDGHGAFSQDWERSVYPSTPAANLCSRCKGAGKLYPHSAQ